MIRAMQLADWLTTRRLRPFCWQGWNCATMALDWMLFCVGREESLPRYTQASAHRRIAAEGGLANVCDRYLDEYAIAVSRPPAALAMTGDVVGIGNKAVAVIGILSSNGQIIVPTRDGLGLRSYPLTKYRAVWRAL
jgi:hypothetical protein